MDTLIGLGLMFLVMTRCIQRAIFHDDAACLGDHEPFVDNDPTLNGVMPPLNPLLPPDPDLNVDFRVH